MNTSGKRDPLDRWYTPDAAMRVVVLHALLREPPPPTITIDVLVTSERTYSSTSVTAADVERALTGMHSGMRVVDPCAGDGAVGRALVGMRYPGGLVEIDADPEAAARPGVLEGTCFDPRFDRLWKGAIVVTNPAFRISADLVDHALYYGAEQVSLLLPFAFRGSDGRRELWAHLADLGLMHPRITYGGPAREAKVAARRAEGKEFADAANGESAVFTWRRDHHGPALLRDLPRWRG